MSVTCGDADLSSSGTCRHHVDDSNEHFEFDEPTKPRSKRESLGIRCRWPRGNPVSITSFAVSGYVEATELTKHRRLTSPHPPLSLHCAWARHLRRQRVLLQSSKKYVWVAHSSFTTGSTLIFKKNPHMRTHEVWITVSGCTHVDVTILLSLDVKSARWQCNTSCLCAQRLPRN